MKGFTTEEGWALRGQSTELHNQAHVLDAATDFSLHIGHHRRGGSGVHCEARSGGCRSCGLNTARLKEKGPL